MKSTARLLAAFALLSALPLAAQAPAKSCTDTIPKACTKVTFLGEDHDCACFVCNPGHEGEKGRLHERRRDEEGALQAARRVGRREAERRGAEGGSR